MIENKFITLANFNCTYKVGKQDLPLIAFFDTMFYPAITDKSLHRSQKTTGYYLTDIDIIEIFEGELAIIGKHVKRVILDIKQDYSTDIGFIPSEKKVPSAPFSYFIILLRNHRVIYFPDQKGSPDIRSFASTVREILHLYNRKKTYETILKVKDNEMIYNDIEIKNVTQLREILKDVYPEATLNVVPIPSNTLISEKMKVLDKIQSLKFRFYNLNSEMDDNVMFDLSKKLLKEVNGTILDQSFSSPKNKKKAQEYIEDSNGKCDFILKGVTIDRVPVTFTPDTLSERKIIPVDIDDNIYNISQNVYNELRNDSVVLYNSTDNLNLYSKCKPALLNLISMSNKGSDDNGDIGESR